MREEKLKKEAEDAILAVNSFTRQDLAMDEDEDDELNELDGDDGDDPESTHLAGFAEDSSDEDEAMVEAAIVSCTPSARSAREL